jgi:site-specific DNA recombinase
MRGTTAVETHGAGTLTAMRAALQGRRDRIEGERQRTIDLVIRSVIAEEDAKQRIAELKTQLSEIEAELSGLDEPPSTVALHPATLQCYIETVEGLSKALADHAAAADDRGPLIQNLGGLVTVSPCNPNGRARASKSRSRASLPPLLAGPHFPKHGTMKSPAEWAAAVALPLRTIVGLKW